MEVVVKHSSEQTTKLCMRAHVRWTMKRTNMAEEASHGKPVDLEMVQLHQFFDVQEEHNLPDYWLKLLRNTLYRKLYKEMQYNLRDYLFYDCIEMSCEEGMNYCLSGTDRLGYLREKLGIED